MEGESRNDLAHEAELNSGEGFREKQIQKQRHWGSAPFPMGGKWQKTDYSTRISTLREKKGFLSLYGNSKLRSSPAWLGSRILPWAEFHRQGFEEAIMTGSLELPLLGQRSAYKRLSRLWGEVPADCTCVWCDIPFRDSGVTGTLPEEGSSHSSG